jgi:hypothetical protein
LWNWLVITAPTAKLRSAACVASESGAPVAVGARKATAPSSGATARQLLPAISASPCLVIASASRWCSRKGSISIRPMSGVVSSKNVSQNQCTIPEKKSAAR